MSLVARITLTRRGFLHDRRLLETLLHRRGDNVEDVTPGEWDSIAVVFKRMTKAHLSIERDKAELGRLGLTLTELREARRNLYRQHR